MSTAYAYSVVKYRDPETKEVKVFQPGDALVGLPRDLVAKLLKRGAAASYNRTKSQTEQAEEAQEREQKLLAKIEDLETQLAAKSQAQGQAEKPAAASTTTPSTTPKTEGSKAPTPSQAPKA
jgi:hypothetical protein